MKLHYGNDCLNKSQLSRVDDWSRLPKTCIVAQDIWAEHALMRLSQEITKIAKKDFPHDEEVLVMPDLASKIQTLWYKLINAERYESLAFYS